MHIYIYQFVSVLTQLNIAKNVQHLQEFTLCAQWTELHPISQELDLQLKTEHLLHLLEHEQTDEASQVQKLLSEPLSIEGVVCCVYSKTEA